MVNSSPAANANPTENINTHIYSAKTGNSITTMSLADRILDIEEETKYEIKRPVMASIDSLTTEKAQGEEQSFQFEPLELLINYTAVLV